MNYCLVLFSENYFHTFKDQTFHFSIMAKNHSVKMLKNQRDVELPRLTFIIGKNSQKLGHFKIRFLRLEHCA